MTIPSEFIIYDGNPGNPKDQTPFGFFDNEVQFQNDGPKVAKFVAERLGYPIMDIELLDHQIYACFEKAIVEYGNQVNQFRARDYQLSLLGADRSVDLTGQTIITAPLQGVVRLSSAYGTEAMVGGNVDLKKGYITMSAGTGSYDLKELWAEPMESGSAMEIRKIYHDQPPAIARYYDPFAATGLGLTNLMAEFGFDGYSPAITFVMMPAYEDLLRVQAIEINDMIRKSNYSFKIHNNVVTFSPIPTSNHKVWFEYYLVDDKATGTGLFASSSFVSGSVSDYSNLPFSNIDYTDINSMGRIWIYKYTLALAKETLGRIRSKYEHIPIPDGEIRLDGELLLRESQEEQNQLLEEIRETLEATSRFGQMKREAENVEAQQRILEGVPLSIYIF